MKNRKGRGRGISQKRQIPVKEFEGLKSSVETMKAEFSDISRLLKSIVELATKKSRFEEPEAQNPQNPDSAQDTGAAQPANYSDGAQSPQYAVRPLNRPES